MTSVLARIGAFFLEPPADEMPVRPRQADEPVPRRGAAPSGDPPEQAVRLSGWIAPTAWSGPAGAPANPVEAPAGPAANRAEAPAGPAGNRVKAPAGRSADPVEASAGRSADPVEASAGPAAAPASQVEALAGPALGGGEPLTIAEGGRADWTCAAVLGAPAAVVPVAAACAGELRARDRAAAAVICIWRPAGAPPDVAPDAPAARPPAGATTPGARRLAARLAGLQLAATACGRLAWLALDTDPGRALDETQRCLRAAAAPVVLAVAGARPVAFEPLLAQLDLAIAVLPADTEPALRELVRTTLAARDGVILPPLAAGPPRWAAMAGLARLRSLPPSQGASRP